MAEGGPLENNQDADNEIDRLRQHFSTIRRRISELVEVAEKERNHDWTIKCLKLVVDYVPTLQESNIGLGIGVNDIRDVLLTGADGQLVKNDQVIDPLSIFETLDRECENWLRDHPEEEPIVPDSATSPLTTVKKCDPLTTFNIIQEKRPYEVYKGAGAALIIKVSDYSSSVHPMNSLPGADADFNNLWNFLTQFKCSVEPCMNQSAEEIRQTIKKWSNKKEVREASIIFVALIGHGNNGIFFASDGDSIPIFDLIQCIDNLHCSDNPRPKIILNLCCRGGLMQVGSNYEKPEEYHMKRPSHLTFKVNPSEGIQTTEATEIVPAHSDFLFIYSTSQHMVATEAPEGNTFLRELLEVCIFRFKQYQK
ncbi:hypothetical protein WR25_23508 isoform C [Diploscapter pachys]|uniref:Caspase family p20 domain-containing protein n=1 Tax=Diploscapter pachys TaxID=2018661 RepID=A0A2A2KUI0_9BILA|nr:hypothetical protein WR25_23508 isoform B [Diploscapter pachys]PAV77667.1 hypothetical protein WR25_23508 isoform C [Diploscapter pachys]